MQNIKRNETSKSCNFAHMHALGKIKKTLKKYIWAITHQAYGTLWTENNEAKLKGFMSKNEIFCLWDVLITEQSFAYITYLSLFTLCICLSLTWRQWFHWNRATPIVRYISSHYGKFTFSLCIVIFNHSNISPLFVFQVPQSTCVLFRAELGWPRSVSWGQKSWWAGAGAGLQGTQGVFRFGSLHIHKSHFKHWFQ